MDSPDTMVELARALLPWEVGQWGGGGGFEAAVPLLGACYGTSDAIAGKQDEMLQALHVGFVQVPVLAATPCYVKPMQLAVQTESLLHRKGTGKITALGEHKGKVGSLLHCSRNASSRKNISCILGKSDFGLPVRYDNGKT